MHFRAVVPLFLGILFTAKLGHRFVKMITILQCLALLLWGIHCLAAEPPKDTSLTGTWSSGTGSVLTGEGFFRINNTFSVPKNTGISYSFVEKSDTTGFWAVSYTHLRAHET